MSTPAGWYDDGHGAQRWWDGAQWTEHVQPVAPAAPGAEPPDPDAAPGESVATDPGAPATGAPAPAAGAPAAFGETPKKSKLWIVWVVLAGVVVILVVLVALLVPTVIRLVSTAAAGGASNDAERGAVQVVELYDDAWDDVDCAAYQAATTEQLRADYGYTDCASFEADAAAFGESVDDYEIAVTSVERLEDGSVSVSTSETYMSYVDEEGADLDQPQPYEDLFVYTVVPQDSGWAIDAIE